MRRRLVAMAAAVLGVMGVALFAPVVPAMAQTGSGIGTCTATVGTQNVGTVTIGQTFVLQLAPTCTFNVGGTLTVTVNGVNIPGKVANANGFTLVTITVLSATQLSIDDPVITPAICGVNTVTASGLSSSAVGGTSTQTATFVVNCATTPTTFVPIAIPITGRLSLTGANSIRYAAVALALVVAGSMAVAVTRRRRADSF